MRSNIGLKFVIVFMPKIKNAAEEHERVAIQSELHAP